MSARLIFVLLTLLFAGCGQEVPPEKHDYIGLSKNHEDSLLITQGGRLEYESNRGAKTTLSAPITKFTDATISAGLLFLTADFQIDHPPRLVDGVWSMMIDGAVLYKGGGARPLTAGNPALLGGLRVLGDRQRALLDQAIVMIDFPWRMPS